MTGERPRRLLLVSYHFGRNCPTGGIRWNCIAQDLVRRGWAIDAITVERPDLEPPFDAGGRLEILPVAGTAAPERALRWLTRLVRRLRRAGGRESVAPAPSGATVDAEEIAQKLRRELWRSDERRPVRERLSSALDGAVAFAADRVWTQRALRQARRLAAGRRYRAVVVSSPPHTTQLVGARIAKECGIPYVGDYRDPWLLGLEPLRDYVDPFERIVARALEPHCLRRAAAILHNTPRATDAIGARLPAGATGRHLSVPNGYDTLEAPIGAPDPDCFRVAFTGWLHPYMDPRPVLAACRALALALDLPPSRLRIEFVGTDAEFATVDLRALAGSYGLGSHFEHRARVPREEARRIQQRAAVKVAYDCPHPLSVPSKFYEYAQLAGTMLLLGNVDGAMADAAKEIGLEVFDLADQPRIDAALRAAHARWQRGELDAVMDREGRFDRRHQTAKIRELLESL